MEYIGHIKYDEGLEKDHEFVIYGAGYFGRKIVGVFEARNKKKIIQCFCDGKAELWDTKIEEILVISPDEAVRKYPDAHFIICGNYVGQMLERLESLHIKKIHLLIM